jgi:hypothetical protein
MRKSKQSEINSANLEPEMRTQLSRKLPSFFLLICFASAATLSGCGKDSVADQVTRQKDRERESASTVSDEYDTASGNYSGGFSSKDAKSKGISDDYLVTANLKTIRVPKDGSLLPQPVISGSFILTNKNRKLRSGAPVRTVFSFTNGSYDSPTRQLSVVIQSVQGTPAIVVNCKKASATDTAFQCVWLSLISDVRVEFALTRIAD